MKISIENKTRKRVYINCGNCGKYRKHIARGLCQQCYDSLWYHNKLNKHKKTGTHTLDDTEKHILITSILDKYEWED